MSPEHEDNQNVNQSTCPEGCCTGGELLCISIPCPVSIVVLGIELTLELPCLRLTSGDNLTSEQVSQLLGVLTSLLGNINLSSSSS